MKTITLKSLHIKNFKGIKNLDIVTESEITTLFGANASGKTTIHDAYRWNLTGKDSGNRADFVYKPTDAEGNTIDKTENQVTLIFDVNGRELKLTRVNKEKWQTPKGQSQEVFKGNESAFFVDDVPMNLRDYQTRVFSELMDEEQIKVLTDCTYFNLKLNWQDRRRILIDMAGDITDQDVLKKFGTSIHSKYVQIIEDLLSSGKKFEDRKKEIASKRKLAKEEKDVIPTRIDEAHKAIPVPLPFQRLREDMYKIGVEIEKLDNQIADGNIKFEAENAAIDGIRNSIKELNTKLFGIENSHTLNFNQEISNVTSAADNIKKEIANLQKQYQFKVSNISILKDRKEKGLQVIAQNKSTIEGLKIQKVELLENWKEQNAKQLVINPEDCQCPTCNQNLPSDVLESKKEEMLTNFNALKKTTMDSLVSRANSIKAEIEGLENRISSYELEISNIDSELSANSVEMEEFANSISDKEIELKEAGDMGVDHEVMSVKQRIENDANYQALLSQIADLNASLLNRPKPDNSDIISKRNDLQSRWNAYQKDLALEEVIKKGNERIEELKEQELKLAQEIANYEAEEFAIQAFLKVKLDLVQETVNNLFSFVKFRMYRDLIGGGEEACCDCLVDGIEYEKNLNTANKINAGIDVINALSKHYRIQAPIFIDNRESVTNIIDTPNQLINLVVYEHNPVPSTIMNIPMKTI